MMDGTMLYGEMGSDTSRELARRGLTLGCETCMAIIPNVDSPDATEPETDVFLAYNVIKCKDSDAHRTRNYVALL
jgi:hypothetical protein